MASLTKFYIYINSVWIEVQAYSRTAAIKLVEDTYGVSHKLIILKDKPEDITIFEKMITKEVEVHHCFEIRGKSVC